MGHRALSHAERKKIIKIYEREVTGLHGLKIPKDTMYSIVADMSGRHKSTVRSIIEEKSRET